MKKIRKRISLCLVLAMVVVLSAPVWAQEAGKVNLNTATVDELVQLKRIGLKYAERIIKFREENGPFKAPEDIVKVPGIGTKTWEMNKDRIVVE